MKQFILSVFAAIATLFSVSAANMTIVERNIPVKKVEQIVIKGSSKVVYTQGSTTNVTIKGASDLVDLIIIENEGNNLTVSQKSGNVDTAVTNFFERMKEGFRNEQNPVIYVTTPDLIGVTLVGSGDFICKGKLDTDNLNVELKGSGDVEFEDIICDNLYTLLQGSGDIDIKQVEAINTTYELKGSGDIDAKQSKVRKCDVSVYGSGDIELKCEKCQLVNAKVTGSGDIDVYGEVAQKTEVTRGSGDIEFH